MSKPGRRQSEIWGQAAFYAGLGFILPGGLAVGYFFGWILDRWFHTAPVLAVVMAILGAAENKIPVRDNFMEPNVKAQRTVPHATDP